jgi:type II restriction/modification system DNA methylase subunit YeeA
VVFCLFAEDIGLLPERIFTRVIENTRRDPARFRVLVCSLFAAMATGGDFGADRIALFDGDVFKDAEVLELTADELALVAGVTAMDWAAIDPSILGTLFERALDPDKRSQLGAHYTSREDIEAIVNPVVIDPLRREWAVASAQVETLLAGQPTKSQHRKAEQLLREFLGRPQAVTVLDPACGSGNFLYVTLQKLKDLEKDVIVFAASHQFGFFPGVGPWQLHGIELNQYAFELAQVTAWIGYLQWVKRNGFGQPEEPILRPLTTFECKDAILDLQPDAVVVEPEWPAAEFIVSNPPFLGRARLREYLGDEYVEGLFTLWEGRVPAEADYCCYWFEKSRAQIAAGRTQRAGLLATQSIRAGASRQVLTHILETGAIFFAESDRPWVLDGAAVRVSMVGFDDGSEARRVLDGKPVAGINADLSTGLDLTRAVVLSANADMCFQGPVKVGDFDIPFERAASILSQPNPHGRPNSDVIRPWLNGKGITDRNPHKFIIDFAELSPAEAALYETPFNHVLTYVRPERADNRRQRRRERWWQHGETVPTWRTLSGPLARQIATARVATHRLFVWLPSQTLPDARLYSFVTEEDWFFGVLHSRVHEVWSLAKAARHGVGNDPTYSTESCFQTFAFPDATVAQRDAVATAARELDAVRRRWLNPPEWTREETLTIVWRRRTKKASALRAMSDSSRWTRPLVSR